MIFAAAGNSGLGAFDAAEQYGKFVIGVDSNQNWVKPGFVLTSMVKRVDNAVYQIVGDMVQPPLQGRHPRLRPGERRHRLRHGPVQPEARSPPT